MSATIHQHKALSKISEYCRKIEKFVADNNIDLNAFPVVYPDFTDDLGLKLPGRHSDLAAIRKQIYSKDSQERVNQPEKS